MSTYIKKYICIFQSSLYTSTLNISRARNNKKCHVFYWSENKEIRYIEILRWGSFNVIFLLKAFFFGVIDFLKILTRPTMLNRFYVLLLLHINLLQYVNELYIPKIKINYYCDNVMTQTTRIGLTLLTFYFK